jgi:hypothetical protein
MEAASVPPEHDIAYYRERFHHAGLPLFDEDFKASTDVFNRAVPLLGLVFIGELLGAVQLEWSLLANLAALAGGLAILLTAMGIVNVVRERPFFSRPRTVGRAELAAFVLVPALLPLIFGGQTTSAWVTALSNLALLAVIYAVYGYGLLWILRWVAVRLTDQLRTSFLLLAKAVPLLMIFGLLSFMSTEMWQVFALEPEGGLVIIGVLFVGLGSAFLLARLPREVKTLEGGVETGAQPLSSKQRRNVGLVLFTSQAVQVLTVTLLVGIFFTVFGLFAVTDSVRESWLGAANCAVAPLPGESPCDVLVEIHLFGGDYELTAELLKVAGGLAAFSGLYFAVAMLTDATYREEFLDEVTEELRQTFRERVEYLKLRAAARLDAG